MSDSQIPAGWYDDPAGDAGKKRYWDGAQWTEQLMEASAFTASAPAAAPEAAQPVAAPAPQPMQAEPAPMNQPTSQGVPTQPYSGAPAPMYVPVPQQADNSGQATAALVLGIVGLFVPWLLAILGYICGILAIVFGMKAKNSSKRGIAIAGIVLGIVTLLFSVSSSIIGVLLVSSSYYYY